MEMGQFLLKFYVDKMDKKRVVLFFISLFLPSDFLRH
jgi:hypothetical protein